MTVIVIIMLSFYTALYSLSEKSVQRRIKEVCSYIARYPVFGTAQKRFTHHLLTSFIQLSKLWQGGVNEIAKVSAERGIEPGFSRLRA